MRNKTTDFIKKYYLIFSVLIITVVISGISGSLIIRYDDRSITNPRQVLELYLDGFLKEDLNKVAAALYPKGSQEYYDFIASNGDLFIPVDEDKPVDGKLFAQSLILEFSMTEQDNNKAKVIFRVTNEHGIELDFLTYIEYIKLDGRWYLAKNYGKYSPSGPEGEVITPGYVPDYDEVPPRDTTALRLNAAQKADYKKNNGKYKSHTIKPTEHIDHETFRGCTYLNEIIIPANYFGFDGSVFYDSPNLIAIKIEGESNYYIADDGVLYNKDKSKLIYFPRGKGEIDTSGNGEFHIPDTVNTIFNFAFSYYSGQIKTFILPSSVKEIADSAFLGAFPTSEYKLILNEGLEKIGALAFSETHFFRLALPSTVTEIGKEAFKDAKNLFELDIPQNSELKLIGEAAFEGAISLFEFYIPNGVEKIENWVFDGCYNLNEVRLHGNIKSIGMFAFRDCARLAQLRIPLEVKYIGKGAFSFAASLKLDIAAHSAPESWNPQWDLGYPNDIKWEAKEAD